MGRLELSPGQQAELDQQLAEFKDHLNNLATVAADHVKQSDCGISSSLCAGSDVFADVLYGTGGNPLRLAAAAGAALRLLGEARREIERLRAQVRDYRA